MNVDGVLTNSLDLTDLAVQKTLGTNFSELTGSWVLPQTKGKHPPTQELGRAAVDAGILALRYASAKNPNAGTNIVVFSDLLASYPPSFLRANDPAGHLQQQLP